MKCPKCGYLGFEAADRCRNCGYEFSLTTGRHELLDLTLDAPVEESRPSIDLDRFIGAPEPGPATDLPLFGDDRPLVSPAPPRAPLGVRRATPEVPRARPRTSRAVAHEDTLFQEPPAAVLGRMPKRRAAAGTDPLAAPGRRILAGLVDVALLTALDAGVLYFTLRLLGLSFAQAGELPLLPLSAFFVVLNGGYFVAFTTVGGQSIGKMAAGIKVISDENSVVPVGRATLRTFAYVVSALPLGAGFLPGILGADRLALHDRLAHTRVVRSPSM